MKQYQSDIIMNTRFSVGMAWYGMRNFDNLFHIIYFIG